MGFILACVAIALSRSGGRGRRLDRGRVALDHGVLASQGRRYLDPILPAGPPDVDLFLEEEALLDDEHLLQNRHDGQVAFGADGGRVSTCRPIGTRETSTELRLEQGLGERLARSPSWFRHGPVP